MTDPDLWTPALRGAGLVALGLAYVVALTRLFGLRSFSKMTSFDFVMTVAMGSLLAGLAQASDGPGAVQSAAAMAGLFLTQWLVARMRQRSDRIAAALQNVPVLLMRDGAFLDDALRATRVTRGDVIAKLREANVLDRNAVRAVVLETTGDISVLHGEHLQEALLSGTQRHDT